MTDFQSCKLPGEDSKTNRDDETNKNYNVDATGLIKIDDKSNLSIRYAHYEKETKTADLLTRDEWKTDNNQSGVDKTGNQLPESGDVNIMGTIYYQWKTR